MDEVDAFTEERESVTIFVTNPCEGKQNKFLYN